LWRRSCVSILLVSDVLLSVVTFFFSSRRRHTRSKRDWSSDVCSSDLTPVELPENMYASVVSQAGGPENFQWREVPVPTPGHGQVLVEPAAAGLNFIETYQRSGLYSVEYPFI